mmetsp:Transcript_15842/g.31526  ORF Transcript_15842/g.31526 Transcript_15842/m.31526 type:complete len:257 (-) Transcript_15842:1779-2549(-)
MAGDSPITSLVRTTTRLHHAHPVTFNTALLASATFLLGSISTSYAYSYLMSTRRSSDRENAGATREHNSLSLFYGDEEKLSQVERDNDKLPSSFYQQFIQNCVTTSVYCVIVRVNRVTDRRECILVERKEEPVKGKWWFPGGRMYKGESFFKAALRKCKEETGLSGTAIQVLGVFNSFFPTSSWDTSLIHGTQTVGIPVLIEVKDDAEILLDDTSQRFRWTSVDPEEEATKGEDQFIVQVLARMKAWSNTFKRKSD